MKKVALMSEASLRPGFVFTTTSYHCSNFIDLHDPLLHCFTGQFNFIFTCTIDALCETFANREISDQNDSHFPRWSWLRKLKTSMARRVERLEFEVKVQL